MVSSKKNILIIVILVVQLCSTFTMYQSRSLKALPTKQNVLFVLPQHTKTKESETIFQVTKNTTKNQQNKNLLKDYIFSLNNTTVFDNKPLSVSTKNNTKKNSTTTVSSPSLSKTSKHCEYDKKQLNTITDELVSKIMKKCL